MTDYKCFRHGLKLIRLSYLLPLVFKMKTLYYSYPPLNIQLNCLQRCTILRYYLCYCINVHAIMKSHQSVKIGSNFDICMFWWIQMQEIKNWYAWHFTLSCSTKSMAHIQSILTNSSMGMLHNLHGTSECCQQFPLNLCSFSTLKILHYKSIV